MELDVGIKQQQDTRDVTYLIEDYLRVRKDSENLCEPLATEDFCIQTMPDVSPTKWHLAHTSWFFETFLLIPFVNDYQSYHPEFAHLFNSYYNAVGQPWQRPHRGMLSRPTVAEVFAYRAHVDTAMQALLAAPPQSELEAVVYRIQLGLNHEQQHQELMLTDIKHVFAFNPLRPIYQPLVDSPDRSCDSSGWHDVSGGMVNIGHKGAGFAYDNEEPRHHTYTADYALNTRLVTNGEYLQFMEDGGYRQPLLWLSDGWATVNKNHWQAPLYWELRDGEWWYMTLSGMQTVDMDAPVCHVSFYEADAYASWAKARLPTEVEWEVAASQQPVTGNLRDTGYLRPVVTSAAEGIQQMFGDVWEWTTSAYQPYPGYQVPNGAIGEYNGKFMCNQMVLRGGSCVTPQEHIRASYRNFFYPGDRWQFSGFRLARDI